MFKASVYCLALILFSHASFAATQFEEVQYTIQEVNEGGLVATLYRPRLQQPVPAVVVIGGSSGRQNVEYSVMLASHGFVALSLAYFNAPELPPTLDEIPVEIVFKGLDYLQSQAFVEGSQLGIIGVSRGSELAFLSASIDPRIRAVTGIVPSSVAWHGQRTRHAWTVNGEAVASLAFERRSELSFLERAQHALAQEASLQEARFKFHKINGPVLLVSAQHDHIWPSNLMSNQIVNDLKAHDFPFAVQHVIVDDDHTLSDATRSGFESSLIRHFEYLLN